MSTVELIILILKVLEAVAPIFLEWLARIRVPVAEMLASRIEANGPQSEGGVWISALRARVSQGQMSSEDITTLAELLEREAQEGPGGRISKTVLRRLVKLLRTHEKRITQVYAERPGFFRLTAGQETVRAAGQAELPVASAAVEVSHREQEDIDRLLSDTFRETRYSTLFALFNPKGASFMTTLAFTDLSRLALGHSAMQDQLFFLPEGFQLPVLSGIEALVSGIEVAIPDSVIESAKSKVTAAPPEVREIILQLVEKLKAKFSGMMAEKPLVALALNLMIRYFLSQEFIDKVWDWLVGMITGTATSPTFSEMPRSVMPVENLLGLSATFGL